MLNFAIVVTLAVALSTAEGNISELKFSILYRAFLQVVLLVHHRGHGINCLQS